MPGNGRIGSFLLVLGLAALIGWLPGGPFVPGPAPLGAGPDPEIALRSGAISAFDHLAHIAALEGDQGCRTCHPDPSQPKTRETSASCVTCHEGVGP
jgi:hypothetical protein